jgi:hypothetical protein
MGLRRLVKSVGRAIKSLVKPPKPVDPNKAYEAEQARTAAAEAAKAKAADAAARIEADRRALGAAPAITDEDYARAFGLSRRGTFGNRAARIIRL